MDKITCKIISDTIQNMSADDFQQFCTQILPLINGKYSMLERHGATKTGQTRKGTPDSIFTDSNGMQTAMQASIDKNYWDSNKNIKKLKPYEDVIKCIENLSSLEGIILMSNQEIPTNNADIKSRFIKEIKKLNYFIDIKIFTLSTFEALFQTNFAKYYSVLKEYLSSDDKNYIEKNIITDVLVKQYICKNFDIVNEILSAKFDNFPDTKNPPIIFNDTFAKVMKTIVNKHCRFRKYKEIETDYNIDIIKQKYPKLVLVDHNNDDKDYYDCSIAHRPFEIDDLKGFYIQKKIVENGYDINKLGNYEYFMEICGGEINATQHNIAEPLFSFLYIKNTTSKLITIENLNAIVFSEKLKVIENNSDEKIKTLPIRRMQIEPNQAVIIPQGILLENLEDDTDSYENVFSNKILKDYLEYGIEESLTDKAPENKIIAPYRDIKEVIYKIDGEEKRVNIKPFDNDLYFSINMFWRCGSCPHIFLHKANSEWIYYGETLSNKTDTNYSYSIPKGYDKVRISELEEEISIIKYLRIAAKNKVFLEEKNLSLKKGEFIETSIDENNSLNIEICGHYECENATSPHGEILKYKQETANKYKKILNNQLVIM